VPTAGGLVLVDTPSLYFRAFHGVPRSVVAPDGTPVNAVRGLLDALATQVLAIRPTNLVCCFDADWRPAFRVALLPSYKTHRLADPAAGTEEIPGELAVQLPIINEVLDAFGIARAAAPGYEADDVIGTLATRHPGPVDILTGDRDLFQLIRDDKPVRVRYTVEKFATVDEASVRARYAIPGRAYGAFAALRGDPSDGLPGVPGIGAKTAAALVERFGSVEAILAAVDAGEQAGFPAGARRKVETGREYLLAALDVVRVVTDIELPPLERRPLPVTPSDPERLVRMCARWGVSSAAARLVNSLTAVAS
jgi:5'-3' exonuclease